MKTLRNLSTLFLLTGVFQTTISMEPVPPKEEIKQTTLERQVSQKKLPPLCEILEKYKAAKTNEMLTLWELLPGPLLKTLSQEVKVLVNQPTENKERLKDCILTGIFAMNLYQFVQTEPIPECFEFAQSLIRVPAQSTISSTGKSGKDNRDERFGYLFNILSGRQIKVLDSLCRGKAIDLNVRKIPLNEKQVLTSDLVETFFQSHHLYKDVLAVTSKIYNFFTVVLQPQAQSKDEAIRNRNVEFLSLFGVPKMRSLCFQIGQHFLDRNEANEALKWFLVSAKAGDPNAMLNLGIGFGKQNNPQMRNYWFGKAALLGLPKAMYYYASTFDKAGEFEEAEKWYRKALAEPSLVGQNRIECTNSLAQLLDGMGRTNEAEALYQKGSLQGDVRAMAELGRILLIKKNLKEAESCLRKEASQGDSNAIFNLGDLLYLKGDFKGAEGLWRSLQNDPEALYDLGCLYHDHGDLEKAEFYFRKASAFDIPEAINNLASYLDEKGDFAEAEQLYRVAAIRHKNTFAMENLGTLLLEKGNAVEAEHWYREGVKLECEFSMRSLGALLWSQGKFVEAEEPFKSSAKLGNGAALLDLACIKLSQGNMPEAQLLYRRAIKKGEKTALLFLAETLELKNPEKGELYRRAVECGVKNAEIFYANYLQLLEKEEEAEIYASLLEPKNEREEKKKALGEASELSTVEVSSSVSKASSSVRNDNNAQSQVPTIEKQPTSVVEPNKFARIHAKYLAAKKASENIKPSKRPELIVQRTFRDVFVTAHPDAMGDIERNNQLLTIVKRFITCLANGEQSARFKKLKSYDDVFSMRITKANRFVFRVLKRDAKNKVMALQILSVSGRYENLDRVNSKKQFVRLPWTKDDDSE